MTHKGETEVKANRVVPKSRALPVIKDLKAVMENKQRSPKATAANHQRLQNVQFFNLEWHLLKVQLHRIYFSTK